VVATQTPKLEKKEHIETMATKKGGKKKAAKKGGKKKGGKKAAKNGPYSGFGSAYRKSSQ
jgi:hypothetical protein